MSARYSDTILAIENRKLKQSDMLKPIKTEVEYRDALAHAYELMQTDLKEGSEASDELEVLSILIKEYELVNYPID